MLIIKSTNGHDIKIDDRDYDLVSGYRWFVNSQPSGRKWAQTSIWIPGAGKKTIIMHRLILGFPEKNFVVDHRDGDATNNCRENIRIVTDRENRMAFRRKKRNSSSRYRGVYRIPPRKTGKIWLVSIVLKEGNRKVKQYSKVFASETEAALDYNRQALAFGFLPEALNKIA